MFIDDDGPRDREALAGPFSGLLCREERVEDALFDLCGDAGARVVDGDERDVVLGTGANSDRAA